MKLQTHGRATKLLREGWRRSKAQSLPSMQSAPVTHSHFQSQLEVDGQVTAFSGNLSLFSRIVCEQTVTFINLPPAGKGTPNIFCERILANGLLTDSQAALIASIFLL